MKSYDQRESQKDDLVDLGQDFKHSIHPEFLENQITLYLRGLGLLILTIFYFTIPYYFKQRELRGNLRQRLKKLYAPGRRSL